MTIRVRLPLLKKPGILRSGMRLGADLLILLGLCGVLVWVWGIGDGLIYQKVQRAQFSRELPDESFRATAPGDATGDTTDARPPDRMAPSVTPSAAAPGSRPSGLPNLLRRDPLLLGELDLPRIQLDVMIREGTDAETLRKAVGHLGTSALPGELGNFVVYGHRDTFFRPLRDLVVGDEFRVRTAAGAFQYVVESLEIVEPEFVRVEPGPDALATLITCYPFTYTGPAPKRLVVRARLAAKIETE